MEIPVEKNKEYIVEIIDNGFSGEGIAKIEDFTIFINGAIKGEKVKVLIVKVLSSYACGKITQLIKTSDKRTDSDCATYKRCGGCSLRHMKYENTLELKRNVVQSLVNKTLKQKIDVENTLGMDKPYNYRNKAQYPVGNTKEDGKAQFGIFANRTHEIIPIEKCKIQSEISQEIAKYIIRFANKNNIAAYNESNGKGTLRHIVIKEGIRTNEVMCILVVAKENIPNENKLIKELLSKFPNIKTIVKNINSKNTNVILGNKNINVYGDGYITDNLGGYIFKISPLSFYQVNPIQAEKLYKIGVESANITNKDVVFDLYCGIGTITIFMAKYAKKVYGIEIVEEAIKMAKENSKLNGIKNTQFLAGDVEEVLDMLINKEKVIPDIVMVDPPRKGLDKKSVNNLLKIKPKKIVYISCNPATLVRDLSLMESVYQINIIKPVDMFPFTNSIECVSVLTCK